MNANQQNHQHGQRVFCFSQSLFGGGSKIWGTVKQCKKYKWVDLDGGLNQDRVRYDRAFWYTEEEYDAECQQIREINKLQAKKEAKEKAQSVKKHKEITSNLSKAIVEVGKMIKVVSKYAPDMHFIYKVTAIENGIIFGLDDAGREVSVGSINSTYFAA